MLELALDITPVVPLCDCHREPMYWQKQNALKTGGRWICHIKQKESARNWVKRNPEKVNTTVQEWRHKNPERYWNNYRRHLLKKFGLTPEQYDEILASQGGCCAICQRPPLGRSLAVDHCHGSGQVRGLLCDLCNTAIGKLGDSPELLKRAIEYLEGE